MARAALESVAYQTNDLFNAVVADGISVSAVQVDGGMTSNDWLMQFLADIIQNDCRSTQIQETTALGAAMLVLLQSDRSVSLQDIADRRKSDAEFKPKMKCISKARAIRRMNSPSSAISQGAKYDNPRPVRIMVSKQGRATMAWSALRFPRIIPRAIVIMTLLAVMANVGVRFNQGEIWKNNPAITEFEGALSFSTTDAAIFLGMLLE